MNTKNPKIIILAGKARAGKDTFASFVKDYAEKNNLKYANLQFSYYIKMYAKILSDWDGSEETKPRTLLQQLGTEVIRYQIDNEFFIKRIIDDIKVLSYFCDIIYIRQKTDRQTKVSSINTHFSFKEMISISDLA